MKLNQNLSAALLALAASAILSFIDNFVAAIANEAGLWQFQVTRTLMAIPLLFIGARLLGMKLLPVNLPILAGRSLIVSTGLMMYFAALGFLPVAQAGAGLFSAPIWVLVFSAILFSRRLGMTQIIAATGGFVGVVLVLGITPASLSLLALVPLTAGAFYGLGMLVTRHWCSSESPAALALGIFLMMGLFSLIALCYFTVWPVNGSDTEFTLRGYQPVSETFYWLTLLQAAGSVIAVSLISQAYRIGDPAYVAVFEYSFLIFAAIWTFLLWGKAIEANPVIGIGLIVFCGGIVALADHRFKKNQQLNLEGD